MSKIFIALTPSSDFSDLFYGLKEKQNKFLTKGSKVNWSNQNQLHITLNYIGQMEPEQKEEMFESFYMENFSKDLPIEILSLNYFPNDTGQVLVANINLSPRLQKLYDRVQAIVARIGFGMSLRNFKPHISLARFKQKNRPFSEIVELENPIIININGVDVYESVFKSGKTKHTLVKSYS